MSHLTKFHQRQALWGIPETPPIPGVNYLYNHYKAAISGDPRPLPAENPTSRAAPGWMLFVNEAIWGRIGQHLNGYVRLVIMYIWLYIYMCVSIYIYIYLYVYCIYIYIICSYMMYYNIVYIYIHIHIYGRWWPDLTGGEHPCGIFLPILFCCKNPGRRTETVGDHEKVPDFTMRPWGEWIITNHIQLFPMDASTFLGSVWGIIYYDLEA